MFADWLKNTIRLFYIRRRRCKGVCCEELELEDLRPFLVIAPHPDDEVFGCGGLIARMVEAGNAPHVVVLTGGEGSHNGCCNTPKADIVTARRRLTREAMGKLGLPASYLHELNFADGKIGSHNQDEYNALKQLIAEIKPSTILVPHHGEGWPDHLAARDLGIKLAGKDVEVYEYCVWMWYYMQRHLDWANAYALKFSEKEHAKKLEAIKTYTSSLAPCGKPWVGMLPKLFIDANSQNIELYFKIR